MRPYWRPLVVGGELSGVIKRDAENASGAYAIRNEKTHEVVYVGESRRGHLWRTLLRHFQAPESFKRVREGFVVRDPKGWEVALWVTSKGPRTRARGASLDREAMRAEATWIETLKPTKNKNANAPELDAEIERDARERARREHEIPDDPFGLLNPRRAWTALGKLTRLSFAGGKGRERVIRFGLRSAPDLVYDAASGRPLAIVYDAGDVREATPAEVKRYRKTHWGEEGRRVVSIGACALPPFEVLGRGIAITYTTNKGDEGGGELADWVHPWGEGARGKWTAPEVVAHVCKVPRCSNRGRIALRGGSYRVTERGIVG